LYDVEAHDKPKGWHVDYINPARMTIPQTNLRIGYFINDHYNISIGFDHMKYVMYNDQRVNYSGYYPNAGTYNENPTADELTLTEDFLLFEHTDGLNYVNTEFCRVDDISNWFGLPDTDKFQINATEGIGAGFLFPKTNTTLLGKDRYDEFHIAGYGISAKAGLNFTFFKYFFIQAELKGGYIEMNDIRTTQSSADSAEQNFWFLQRIITVGGIFRL
jgi:cytochrome c1